MIICDIFVVLIEECFYKEVLLVCIVIGCMLDMGFKLD